MLSDHEIKWCAENKEMIVPFCDEQLTKGVISYGISSYGYDVRVGTKFKVFDTWLEGYNKTIDPKSDEWHSAFSDYDCEERNWKYITIPPNSFALGETVEVFNIPRDILCIVVGKSSYARCGIIVNVTPLEPEWKGKVTMEISNTTPLPARIYANEGIAQVIFLRSEVNCKRSYADKKGKYQGQTKLTLPSVNQ